MGRQLGATNVVDFMLETRATSEDWIQKLARPAIIPFLGTKSAYEGDPNTEELITVERSRLRSNEWASFQRRVAKKFFILDITKSSFLCCVEGMVGEE